MNEPLTVTTKDAFAALGVKSTKGYELINSGDLEAIKIGRGTRVVWASVKRYVERAPRLQAA